MTWRKSVAQYQSGDKRKTISSLKSMAATSNGEGVLAAWRPASVAAK